MKTLIKHSFVLIIAVLLTGCGVSNKKQSKLVIKNGMHATQIAKLLEENGFIKSRSLFLLFLKATFKSEKMKAGTYLLKKPANYLYLTNKLTSGSDYYIKVTIPEGFTAEQIAARLLEREIIDNADDFINHVVWNNYRGYLFPETYNFSPDEEIIDIINIMKKQFDEKFTVEYERRTKELGFSKDEMITLASLVEKEAKVPEERPIIADIFHKRLKKRIYLESCASVLFALGLHKKRLTYEDLEIKSPYNTYRNFGLPPTPICNPGLDSIKAALYPKKTNFLYFFAKGTGEHVFTGKYEDHLRLQKTLK